MTREELLEEILLRTLTVMKVAGECILERWDVMEDVAGASLTRKLLCTPVVSSDYYPVHEAHAEAVLAAFLAAVNKNPEWYSDLREERLRHRAIINEWAAAEEEEDTE